MCISNQYACLSALKHKQHVAKLKLSFVTVVVQL